MPEPGELVAGFRAAHGTDSGAGRKDAMPQERPVEHDSVVSVVARNKLSIPERVSGSRRKQPYLLDVAPQAYQSSFAANILRNNMGWVGLMPRSKSVSNQVGIEGAIRCARPVELVCAKSNSQVLVADSCPKGSS